MDLETETEQRAVQDAALKFEQGGNIEVLAQELRAHD